MLLSSLTSSFCAGFSKQKMPHVSHVLEQETPREQHKNLQQNDLVRLSFSMLSVRHRGATSALGLQMLPEWERYEKPSEIMDFGWRLRAHYDENKVYDNVIHYPNLSNYLTP